MLILLNRELTNIEQKELQGQLKPFYPLGYLVFFNQPLLVLQDEALNIKEEQLLTYPFIERIIHHTLPYPLASKLIKKEPTTVQVEDQSIGGKELSLIVGPCSVESPQQLKAIASQIKGIDFFRAGCYKPRTSPYGFQGLEDLGLSYLKELKQEFSVKIVSEIIAAEHITKLSDCIAIYQVGARNMQNYHLLKALAKTNKAVLLKRNYYCSIDEWLMSAEYLLAAGNTNVILCERGTKTLDTPTGVFLDLNIIKTVKEMTHLPLIVDPSHASGDYQLVEQNALNALEAGADGLMIEVHNNPQASITDSQQSLSCEDYNQLYYKIKDLALKLGRTLSC